MRIMLSASEMAVIALDLLRKNKGFTIDEYGCTPEGKFWTVSVEGKEKSFVGLPTLREIEQYLLRYPILDGHSGAYFGGWVDEDGTSYLDHTLLFAYKHSAVQEGIRQKQRAIFYLETKETLKLSDPSLDEIVIPLLYAPSPAPGAAAGQGLITGKAAGWSQNGGYYN